MHIQELPDGSILLTAPVMVPGAKDCDYDRGEPPLNTKEILDFKESYEKYSFVDSEHEITRTGRVRGEKYESYILPKDTELELYDGSKKVYPKGTWMMTSHVTDPEAITTAKKGGYTGYSVAVRNRKTADKFLSLINAQKYNDAMALKSQSQAGLIRDIVDPVVLSVTLTKKPCLHASKYCNLNVNEGEKNMSDNEIKSRVLKALGMSEEAEVEALKSEVGDMKSAIETMKTENAEALKSMKEELTTAFSDALKEAFETFADKSEKKKNTEEEEEEEEGDSKGSNEEEGEGTSENNTSNEEGENEEEEEEPPKTKKKGKSKAKPNHNNNDGSDKSEIIDTYAFLGRNPDGTRKRK